MDNKEWMDKIRKSGMNVEAPDELAPENIKRMLEDGQDGRKRWRRYARWAAAAAASVLVITGSVFGLTRFAQNRNEADTETGMFLAQEEAQETAVDSEKPDTRIKEQTTEKQTETSGIFEGEQYAFAGAADDREIYDALKELDADAQPRDMGMEKEEVAEEDVADMAASDGALYESASAVTGGGFSRTNLQELGVDEADVVKTDGAYIYVLKTTGRVQIIRAEKEKLEITASIVLQDLNETPKEMYVDGDLLNVIASGSETAVENEEEDVYRVDTEDYTKLYTYDLSDRTAPKKTGEIRQQGSYASSRKNGDILYLFTRFGPELTTPEARETYIPEVDGTSLRAADVYIPEVKNSSQYLVISSVSNQKPDQVIDKKAVISAAENFYVSGSGIYVANTDWREDGDRTQILKFSYKDGVIIRADAADLKGYLNNTFSLNEYNGYLRAVLTDWSGDTQQTTLYVLDESMEITGSIQNIAEGEEVRSARFFGDTGYFVTYRNIDPLFSVDLSDPENPRILGELKVTGFSSYLHFYGENLLLGVGEETNPETGAYIGIKLSMFDISDPGNVKELHKYVMKDMYDCPLFYNYKAAMIDPGKNVFGFMCDSKYMVFTYDPESGFENVFAEDLKDAYYSSYYYGTNGMRGCYIGDTFYLIGGGQIRVYDMADHYNGLGSLEL